MKKLAANYVLSDSGCLLKNGILITGDDGHVAEIVDTRGDLDEMAQLTFYNGILLTNNLYFRKHTISSVPDVLNRFISLKLAGFEQLSASEIIGLAKQTQSEFPELKISEITTAIFSLLGSFFRKEKQSGVFLLMHADLIGQHFRPESRLKRML